MNQRLPVPIGILLLFFNVISGHAQQSSDSVIYNESLSNLQQTYFNEVGDNAQIFHGSKYIRNGQRAAGFPYYGSDNMQMGVINYQGVKYSNMELYYDMVADNLIINNYVHNALINLSSIKATSFSVGGHSFVYLISNKKSGSLPKDGYYDELVKGDPGVYVRREKRLVIPTNNEEIKYVQYDAFYICLINNYYPVDSKSDLLDVFKDQKDLMKKYIHANKLNFKNNLESSIVLATRYYTQLKH